MWSLALMVGLNQGVSGVATTTMVTTTMVTTTMVTTTMVTEQPPLTTTQGDTARGKQWILSEDKGNCLLCHQVNGIEADFQGNIGPDLSNVGARLSAAAIRFRIVDPKRLFPNTIMPAYYQTQGLKQVSKAYQNRTILSAQEVEDIVAYLVELNSSEAPLKNTRRPSQEHPSL